MKIKVKKLSPDAVMPAYATEGAGAFDLVGFNKQPHKDTCTYDTGLAFEIPKGYVMLVFSRSGHGFKDDMRLANCVGVIDSDYRGEVKVKLTRDNGINAFPYSGDRIAQGMLIKLPKTTFEEVEELSATDRGQGGFGSTGNK